MIAVVLLAAGQGTRMNSRKQKILHEVGGRPMVLHAFLAAAAVAGRPPVLVIGPGETGVPALLGDRAEYVVHPEALGTGHATMMAADALRGRVSAVNSVFIECSNELGAFESGGVARLGELWLGRVGGATLSVVLGGFGTILVVGWIARKWPELRRLGRLEVH